MNVILPIIKQFRYQLVVVALWACAFCVVYPVGEFAVNDDWAYAKNVRDLVVNKTFVVDTWPAMNLVSQTMYGSIVAFLFGFSLTALRLSMLALAVAASLTLFRLVHRLSGKQPLVAFLFVCAFFFSAIAMHLSMTFMTDIFFVSFLIFSLHFLYQFNTEGKWKYYAFFVACMVVAILCRQQGLLFTLLIAGGVFKHAKSWPLKIGLSLLPIVLSWCVAEAYHLTLRALEAGQNIQELSGISAKFFEISLIQHFTQGADLLLVLGWLLLPLVATLVALEYRTWRRPEYWLLSGSLVVAALLTVAGFGHYPIGNINELLQIGPRTIRAASSLLVPEAIISLKRINYFIATASLSAVIFFVVKRLRTNSALYPNTLAKWVFVFVVVAYTAFIVVSRAYFDRYALPLALVVVPVLVPTVRLSNAAKWIGLTAVSLVFAFAVVENRDYFNWQKQRQLCIEYLKVRGIPDSEIDGGFEYNGWVKNHDRYTTDPALSWWWVEQDRYVLSGEPIEGYTVDTVVAYESWLPPVTDSLFVLRKQP